MPSSSPNHPPLSPQKTGVLLLNLGTPDSTDYWSVRRYLSEFLSDKRVIDYPSWLWQPLLQGIILTSRPFRSGAAYRKIWDKKHNASPLLLGTQSITNKLAKAFDKDIIVEYAMRYGNPSTASGIEKLTNQGCTKILLFALYPQYSATTTATAYEKAFEAVSTYPRQPALRTASAWHDDPHYIKILANSVTTHLKKQKKKPEAILTSFHGLPKRYLTQGDPYHCFCQKTSRLLREQLKWPEDTWHTTFQSRFGPEEWLQPYTDKTLIQLAKDGVKHIAVLSPAFICECLETLEEIAMEGKELFLEHGGKSFTYIPCLSDSKAHIDFLAKRVKEELSGWV